MPLTELGRCPEAERWGQEELDKWEASLIRSAAEAEAALHPPLVRCLAPPTNGDVPFEQAVTELVQRSGPTHGPILVTSTLPGEGKTTTALGLATAAARDGKRCLLIDSDCRFPGIPRYRSDIEPSPGLREASRGLRTPEQFIQRGVETNLDVLPCGLGRQDQPDDFAALARTLERASEPYEVVLVDTSPFLPFGDTFYLCRALQRGSVFVVAEAGRATSFGLKTLGSRLAETPTHLAALLLTRLNDRDERIPTSQCWSAHIIGSALASHGKRAAVGACFVPPGSAQGVEQWWFMQLSEGTWRPFSQLPECDLSVLEAT